MYFKVPLSLLESLSPRLSTGVPSHFILSTVITYLCSHADYVLRISSSQDHKCRFHSIISQIKMAAWSVRVVRYSLKKSSKEGRYPDKFLALYMHSAFLGRLENFLILFKGKKRWSESRSTKFISDSEMCFYSLAAAESTLFTDNKPDYENCVKMKLFDDICYCST